MKKTSPKSVKSNKGQSLKPALKKRQTPVRKSVSPGTKGKAKTCRVKALVARRQLSAKPLTTAAPKHAETGKTLVANTPKHGSTQLRELERGRQWKQLREQGLSLAVIAEKFGCSKTLARNLSDLASLPKGLEEGYLQGKMGRKAVLGMARKRKKENATKANQ